MFWGAFPVPLKMNFKIPGVQGVAQTLKLAIPILNKREK
jgi:hypothetical protein